MPIELRCPGCQGLLRVPDSAAGQSARCPQCSTVIEVPAPGAAAAPQSEFRPSDPANRPFAPSANDPVNPYAAPAIPETSYAASQGGELHHTILSFDDLFNTTWQVYKSHFGPMAVLGGVLFGIAVGQYVAGFIVGQVGAITRDVAVVVGLHLILNLASMVLQVAVTLAGFKYCLTLLRTGRTELGEFMGIGPCFLSGLLKDLTLALGALVLTVVCLGPALATIPLREEGLTIIVFIAGVVALFIAAFTAMTAVFIAGPLIVDRGVGPIESLKMSWEFSSGNRLTLFLTLFVVGLLGTLFSCCTLYVGFIFFLPYISLFTCVTYVLMTGQRHTIAPEALGQRSV